jgi:hypothetical protein
MQTFNGFGKHTTSDMLYHAAILPYTPLSEFIRNDELFEQFRGAIVNYTAIFKDPSYFSRVASNSNASNPFAFHISSNNKYIEKYVGIYRKQLIRMPASLYNQYGTLGLFDPYHTIGDLIMLPMLDCDFIS